MKSDQSIRILFVLSTILNLGTVIFSLDNESAASSLTVYWNVPTFQCSKYGISFADLISGTNSIKMNKNDNFRGDAISILYDPGVFPALLEDQNQKFYIRNGGVPQNGNLELHLDFFRNNVSTLAGNYGLAVIDFESWRPIYRQNFGKLEIYKDLSDAVTRTRFPFFPLRAIKQISKSTFENNAKIFMSETIKAAKKLKPGATWGYYGYPYCFNSGSNSPSCPEIIKVENYEMLEVFSHVDNFYPSIYLSDDLELSQYLQITEARLIEAKRVSNLLNKRIQIIPYFSFKYRNNPSTFVSKETIMAVFNYLRFAQQNGLIDGVVLWGSSKYVNSLTKCTTVYNYTRDVILYQLKQHNFSF